MANSYTTNLSLAKPARGDVDWDDEINGDLDTLDTAVGTEHNSNGTHKNTINIGDNANSVDKKIVANTGEANEPYLSYDVSENEYVIANDGQNPSPLLTAAENVLEVAKSGKKYSTIQSALNAASAGDVAALVEVIRAEDVPAIFVGTSASQGLQDLAETIADELGGEVHVLTLLTGSLAPEGQPGDTYLGFIRYNVDQIVDGLAG